MASHKDASVLAYEKKLERNPVSLIFSRLADSYRKRGDIQLAIDVCSRGLAHHPDSTSGRIILGRCYLEQEKLKEALQEFMSVIGRDRCNQAAIKMLADIYARQGMKDKAGDLYAYLFARDPGNGLLDNLAKTHDGAGKTNIYEILGFSLPRPDAATSSDSSAPNAHDIFEEDGGSAQAPARGDTAFDRTIKFDAEELTTGTASQDAGAFAQTLQYDAEDLKSGSGTYEVEEVVSDVKQNENDSITGDDISERMTMMFDEEGPKAGTTDLVSDFAGGPGGNDAEPSSPSSIDVLTPPSTVPEVSGSDISSRIDQLFGEKPVGEAPHAQQDFTQMFDVPAPAFQHTGEITAADASEEILNREVSSTEQEQASSDVSGEDVVSRMAEMFEQPDEKNSREAMAILPEGGEAIEGPSIMPQREVSEEERPSEGLLGEAAIAEAPLLNAAETPEAVFKPATQSGGSLPDASISGDDIAQRLESIFDEEPVVVQAPMETSEIPDRPQPLENSVADDESFLATEDSGDSMAAEATVIQEKAAGGDRMAEQPPLEIEKKANEDTAFDDSLEAMIQDTVEKLDDALPVDETPEMSGNDILTRLDEIFPEALLTNETLSMVADIPEGGKDEENVNQGFYTMSGENAETAQLKEPLLEKLDDIEFEVPLIDEVMDENLSGKDIFAEQSKAPSVKTNTLPRSEATTGSAGDTPQEYSIPDHVLTPTLADIYFQQGQPQLAVEIYERLLRKDPDNERICRRINEIKKHIALSGDQIPMKKEKPAKVSAPRANKSVQMPKPLAGVHIKKSFKKKPKER